MSNILRNLSQIFCFLVLSLFLFSRCTNPEVALPEEGKNKSEEGQAPAAKLYETPTIMIYPAESSPAIFYYYFALAEANGAKDNLLFPVPAELKKVRKALDVFQDFYGEKPVILGISTPKEILTAEVIEKALRVVIVSPDEEVKKIPGLVFMELPKEGESTEPAAQTPAVDLMAAQKQLQIFVSELKTQSFISKEEPQKPEWTLGVKLPSLSGLPPKEAIKGMIQGLFIEEKLGIFIDAEPFEKKLLELKIEEAQLGDTALAAKALDAFKARFLLFASLEPSNNDPSKPSLFLKATVYDGQAKKVVFEKSVDLLKKEEEKPKAGEKEEPKKEAEEKEEKKEEPKEIKKGPPAKRIPDILSDSGFVAGLIEKVTAQSPGVRVPGSDELIYLKGKSLKDATLILYSIEEKENKEKFKLAAGKEGYFSPFVFNPKAPFMISMETSKQKAEFFIRGLAHSYSFFELLPLETKGTLVYSVFRPLDFKEFDFPEPVLKKLAAYEKKIFYRLKIQDADTLAIKEKGDILEIHLPEKLSLSVRWPEKPKTLRPGEVYILLD